MSRLLIALAVVSLAGCAPGASPVSAVDPERAVLNVTCGGPGFPTAILEEPGSAERNDDPAAEALRRHLADPALAAETTWLPDTGWREAVRTDTAVTFVADAPPGTEPPLVDVNVALSEGSWKVSGWGQCWPKADVGPDLGLASFRVAPGVELAPDLTAIDVLVTEHACNSGQDARGRIVAPAVIAGMERVTVVFAVRPRAGGHDCPSNPETPFRMVLDEPLGDRALMDGSSVPPRDATTCTDTMVCP